MRGLRGMTALLLATPFIDRQQSDARTIAQAGQKLREVIDDIRDFSKLDDARLTLRLAPFHWGELGEDVVDLFAAQAAPKRIGLKATSRLPASS